MTTKKASGLKVRRVEASITRKVAAEAAGISQFKLDKIERGVDVAEETRKAYDTGLAKLLAQAAKTSTTTGTKPNARTSTARKPAAKPRKATQPKPEAKSPAA